MSLFARLFGGGGESKAAEPELHKGFRIFPEPVKESDGYRIAARIELDVDGEVKTHQMIRADTYSSRDTAVEASLSKAQMFIDQMGERIFD